MKEVLQNSPSVRERLVEFCLCSRQLQHNELRKDSIMRFDRDDLPAVQGDDLGRGEIGQSDQTAGYDVHRAMDQGDGDAIEITGGNADVQRAMDQGDGDPSLLPDAD